MFKSVTISIIFLFSFCVSAFGLSSEKSGLIYYPDSAVTDHGSSSGRSVNNVLAGVEARAETCTIKFIHIGSGETTGYNFATEETIPSYVTVEFEPGAVISTSGVSVILPPPENIDAAPNQQIFLDSGVTFPNPGTIYPNWWGFSTTGSAPDNAAALENVMLMNDCRVKIPAGYYTYNSGVTLTAGLGPNIIEGDGWGTILNFTGSDTAISIVAAPFGNAIQRGTVLQHFRLVSDSGTPQYGIHCNPSPASQMGDIRLQNLSIEGFETVGYAGLIVDSTVGFKADSCHFADNYYGMTTGLVRGNTTTTFTNCQFRSNEMDGAYIRTAWAMSFTENCVFESNVRSGLTCTLGDATKPMGPITIKDSWFENNCTGVSGFQLGINGLDATYVASQLHIDDNVFNDLGTYGYGHVQLGRCNWFTLNDNSISTEGSPYSVQWSASNLYFQVQRNSGGTFDSSFQENSDWLFNLDIRTSVNNTTHRIKGGYYSDTVPGDGASGVTICDWNSVYGGLAIVSGNDTTAGHGFQDLVSFGFSSVTTITSFDTVGTPASRTYSNPTTTSLGLVMGNDSKTYKVRATQIGN